MASTQVTGVLKTPSDEVASNVQILIISRIGYGDTLTSSQTYQITDPTGNYDFPLVYGTHSIAVKFADRFVTLGTVVVNAETPNPATINELLEMTTVPIQPEWVTYVEQLTARAEQAANDAQGHSNDAAGFSSQAQGYANDSAGSASEALGYRNEAEQFRNQAEEIAGLDQVDEAVDAAIDARNFMVMSEAQAKVIADQNQEKYPASGFVHYGKQYNSGLNGVPINEGMWARINADNPDTLHMGRDSTTAGLVGASKTNFAVTHIAGFVSKVMAFSSNLSFPIKFPEAEAGYRTYDTATGASLNYLTEVDPKYGDIAGSANEAVARAWEGSVTYGDNRDGGTVGKLKYNPSATLTNENGVIWSRGSSGWNGIVYVGAITADGEHVVECVPHHDTNLTLTLYANVAGVGEIPLGECQTGKLNTIKVSITGATGANITLFHKATSDVGFSYVSIRPATNSVVTDRHDLVLFEQHHELVTDNEVFPTVIQNESSTVISGIPMKLSARKKSYFQVYDGQYDNPDATNDEFYCWDWSVLTIAQKEQVATYLGANLYVADDGTDRLVNVRLRQRTIAGAGNGDWDNADSTASSQLRFDDNNRVKVKGDRDVDTSAVYTCTNNAGNLKPNIGVFSSNSASVGYNGECYALVIGVVKRLNQGAYHPRFNEQGARYSKALDGDGGHLWHQSGGQAIKSAKECFIIRAFGDNQVGAYSPSGYIAIGISGRYDDRFYDAIYASGHGGMYDKRLSASDITPYMGEIREKIKAGKYRGKEKVKFTKFFDSRWGPVSSGMQELSIGFASGADNPVPSLKYGDIVGVLASDETTWQPCKVVEFLDGVSLKVEHIDGSTLLTRAAGGSNNGNVYLTHINLNSTVSGSFTTKMVIGDPVNILQTPELQAGWEGTWCPVIPPVSGTTAYPVSRKSLVTNGSRTYTTNNGDSWTNQNAVIDAVTNVHSTSALTPTTVCILSYTAYAAQTEPTTNAAVYQGEDGVKDVFNTMDYRSGYGVLLGESLIGKVFKSNSGNRYSNYPVTQLPIGEDGKIISNASFPIGHVPIGLSAPQNNSAAVKALAYDHVSNQQMQPHFAFNELVWNQGKSVPSGFTAVSGTESYSFVAGERYKITTPSRTICVLCVSSVETTFNLLDESTIGWQGSSTGILYMIPWDGTGWGDDSTIRIIDNVGTFNNLNGDTCLYGTHKLAVPCGWVKNVAKAGSENSPA